MRTITHEVRSFLQRAGARIEPWSGLGETYDELYALLRRRRDDPAFWPPLEALLRAVVAHAARRGAESKGGAQRAELLTTWDVEALIRTLRSTLAGPEPRESEALTAFLRRLSPAVLGGFVLLGIAAAGCGGKAEPGETPDGGGGGVAGAATGDASGGTGGIDISTGGTGGALVCVMENAAVIATAINDSTTTESERAFLCTCLSELNASWSDALTELFETGTDIAISQALAELLDCCSYYGPDTFDGDYAAAQSQFLAGTLCEPVILYKGVWFPE